jgi:hypothetical protein
VSAAGERDPRDPNSGASGLGALPGMARVGAELGWHSAGWVAGASMRAAVRLARAATSAQSAAELVEDVRVMVRQAARDLIDVTDLEDRLRDSGAASSGVAKAVASVVPQPPSSASASAGIQVGSRRASGGNGAVVDTTLTDRGAQLIRLSRDVHFEDEAHPAYERILSELAPDEGRVLLLLLTKGPQPAVDVRTGGPLGLISSKLIAPGLSMIGSRAGLRYVDRVPAYLNNLFRLGLVWFSHETVPDHMRYQVLEAQPDVLAAIHSVRQAKVVRRSIHLTPFGEDFCRTCLPVGPAELAALPHHSAPPEDKKVSKPPAPTG